MADDLQSCLRIFKSYAESSRSFLWAKDWLGSQSLAIYAVTMVSQWQYTGYTMVLFIVALQKIPEDLYEAATIDGAGRLKRFFHITIPQAKEMIIVNMDITIIGSFKVFDEIM